MTLGLGLKPKYKKTNLGSFEYYYYTCLFEIRRMM